MISVRLNFGSTETHTQLHMWRWMRYDMVWYDDVWYDMIYGMIWYGTIWYDIWYDDIWYDMVRYNMIWYGMVRYDMIYDICYDIWHDMIYLLTTTGSPPRGSSTVQFSPYLANCPKNKTFDTYYWKTSTYWKF